MSEARDVLERALQGRSDDPTPTELVGNVAGDLPEETTLADAKEIAADLLGEEAAPATDGGTQADNGGDDDPTDLPTPADGEAHYSGTPEYTETLRKRDWWVNWVKALPQEDGEIIEDATPTKQPVAPYDNGHARPALWNSGLSDDEHPSTSFVDAVPWDGKKVGLDVESEERVTSDELGIGIIIPVGGGEGRPITLLDWDDVRDPETGEIHPVCAWALTEIDGFAEISQSGEGIHQFVYGTIPGGFSKFLRHIDTEPFVGDDLPMVEMYSSGRLTAMTGDHVAGCGNDVVDGQDLIDELCHRFGDWDNNAEGTPTDPFARDREDGQADDVPSHEEIGESIREAIEYDGDDPEGWDLSDDEPLEYHALLRARAREQEIPNLANWELLGYTAATAYHADIEKEQVIEDLRAHPRPGYEFDENKARKEIRGTWNKAKAGNYEAPSRDTLVERGILPDKYAALDYPTYDVENCRGVELMLVPVNGKEVKVVIEQNGRREFTETLDRGFWASGTKRGRVAGRVVDAISGVEPDVLRAGVKNALNQANIDADDDEENWSESMRSESERELRDRTLKVICYPTADEAEWVVTMRPPVDSDVTEPQTLTFDQGDFNDSNAGTFRNSHLAAFYSKVDIDASEWDNLVDHWLSVQETKSRDPDHLLEAAIEKFTDWVNTMEVWADGEGFTWSNRNGYYQPDYAEDGTDAILVPGQKVVEWQHREDFGDVNLSRALRDRNILLGPSQRESVAGDQRRAWPVNVNMTTHTEENARRTVSEDDDDERPEGMR